MDIRSRLATALADRYALEEEIGEGGMATVFRARDLRHDRPVAVKVLKPDLGAVLGGERFLAEIKVTANLQHPNLLPLFDSGQADGLLFYVMPFVRGESLRARLERETQLPVEEALRIAKALAGALDHAHRQGVIHRDLKPENILMQDGQPLIADFGIALAVRNAGGQRVTQTGLSLGTPQYMSPEQATGDRQLDARSDLYSLGAIVYEMLAGEPAHSGATAQAVIARLMTEEPRPLRQVRRTVPVSVERAVRCAMEKLPADRFASAREFAEALEGRATVLAAYDDTDGAPAARSSWRTSPLWAPACGVALLALVTLGAWTRGRGGATGDDDVTVRFPLVPPAGHTLNSQVAIAPDGRTMVFGARDSVGRTMLFLRAIDAVDARPIPGSDLGGSPAFSPDGEQVAFVADGELRKTRLKDGTTSTLARVQSGLLAGSGSAVISWAAPGRVVLSMNGRIGTVSASGGAVQFVPTPDSLQQESQTLPLALPDDRTVIYTRWYGAAQSARLAALSLADGTFHDLGISGVSAIGYLDGYLVYLSADANVMAVRLDLGSFAVQGEPAMVLTEVKQVAGALDGRAAASMSRNGTLVYQAGRTAFDLLLTDGTTETQVIPTQADMNNPRYSPDGKRIAVTLRAREGADIWVYTAAGGTLQRLTTEGTQNDRPEWSPDGQRVLFRSNRGGKLRLWSQPVTGGEARLELERPGKDIWEGVYTPDGAWIIYRTGTLGSADVWAAPTSGKGPDLNVSADKFQANSARPSPDGAWVAYTSYASGSPEVFVARFPAMTNRLQVSQNGGTGPVWADDHTLYYQSYAPLLASSNLTRVTLSTAGEPTVLQREPVVRRALINSSGHASFDVARDGKHLLVLAPSEQGTSTVVAYGWQRELRRLLAAANTAAQPR
ncbi:MAG: serine/threonine-protein kinase [Gemmatimonadetes bacterium]|nr:serine/threonine-protein kinase [Gemmatimonadota bacterium]